MRNVVRQVGKLKRRFKRARFIASLRLRALAAGASLDLDIANDIEIRPRVRVEIGPGTKNVVRMGKGNRLMGDNVIRLVGGTLDFGEAVEIRRGTMLNITGGTLRCVGGNKISYFNMVHVSTGVTLDTYTSTSEFCSIIDVSHNHDGTDGPFYAAENDTSAPIFLGRNTWMGSKSTVTMGVSTGRDCVIAAGAVVNKDVADGEVVGGVPARVISRREVGKVAAKPA